MTFALVVALLLALLAGTADAQTTYTRKTGSITSAGSDCTTATACVTFSDVTHTANGTIVLSGTWVGTVQFEGSLDTGLATSSWFALSVLPQGSSAYVTSATATGQWVVPIALVGLRVRASAYTSGTVSVTMVMTSARSFPPPFAGGMASLAAGACPTPSLNFLADTTTGLYNRATGFASVCAGGGAIAEFGSDATVRMASNVVAAWYPGGLGASAIDTGMSRLAANSIAFGNGSAADRTATINMATAVWRVPGNTTSSATLTQSAGAPDELCYFNNLVGVGTTSDCLHQHGISIAAPTGESPFYGYKPTDATRFDVAEARVGVGHIGVIADNGANIPATLSVYGVADTWTGPSWPPTNYERLTFAATGSVNDIDGVKGGTGVANPVRISSTGPGTQLGGATLLTLVQGEVGLPKITASGSAPGATGGKYELVCGTGAGSAKLIVYAGTSATPVTIVDNIGAGVTGC